MEEEKELEFPNQSDPKLLNASNLIITIGGVLLIGSIGTVIFFTLGIWTAIAAASVLCLMLGLMLLYINMDIIWPDNSNNDYYNEEDTEPDEPPSNTAKVPANALKEKMQADPELTNQVNNALLTTVATIIQLQRNKTKKGTPDHPGNKDNSGDIPHQPTFSLPDSAKETPKPPFSKEEQDYENLLKIIEEHEEALISIATDLPDNNIQPVLRSLKSNPMETGYGYCIEKTLSSINLSGNLALIQREEEITKQLNEHFEQLRAACIKQHSSPLFYAEERKREEETYREQQYLEDRSKKLTDLGLEVLDPALGYSTSFSNNISK